MFVSWKRNQLGKCRHRWPSQVTWKVTVYFSCNIGIDSKYSIVVPAEITPMPRFELDLEAGVEPSSRYTHYIELRRMSYGVKIICFVNIVRPPCYDTNGSPVIYQVGLFVFCHFPWFSMGFRLGSRHLSNWLLGCALVQTKDFANGTTSKCKC